MGAMGGETRKEVLKRIIRRLHQGEPPERLKEEFRELLSKTRPDEIARMEQELIEEGIPREEIRRLCDLHLEVFREAVEGAKVEVPEWHPLHILMEEHKRMLELAGRLAEAAARADLGVVREVADHFREYERHMEREENILFPLLERHGVTEPPTIMWTEHNDFREMRKRLLSLLEGLGKDFKSRAPELERLSRSIYEHLSSHYFKENNILFPTALRLLSPEEWRAARAEFDEIGYCCFTPPVAEAPPEEKVTLTAPRVEEGMVEFETGSLSVRELEAILNTLPVDITFVDAEDTVRYFNDPREGRTFVRTKAVLGRKVQQCHPQKSLHLVNKILEDFRSGRRDVAEFWIQREGRLIHIRYFPVRDKEGRYLGCIEVTQDITEIKRIEGERRLLDEEPEGREEGR